MKGRVYVFKNEMKNTGKPSLTGKWGMIKKRFGKMERTYNQELIIALHQEQRHELKIFMDWLFFISKKKKNCRWHSFWSEIQIHS